MTSKQIKQALISIVVGALTVFAVNLLEGLLHFINEWIANGAGATVASASYFVKNIRG